MRLTHLKVTGGTLKVKMRLDETSEDKAEQIRIYSGTGFQNVTEAGPGTICVLIGPRTSYAGQGLGIEKQSEAPILEPVLTYRLQPQVDCDMHSLCLASAIGGRDSGNAHRMAGGTVGNPYTDHG